MEITLIIILAAIVLDVVLAVNANVAAVAKGYDGSLYGILCFLTGPLGLILVAALLTSQHRRNRSCFFKSRREQIFFSLPLRTGSPLPNTPTRVLLRWLQNPLPLNLVNPMPTTPTTEKAGRGHANTAVM